MLTFDCSRFWQLHLSCADKGLHISMEGNRINQSILMMDILGFLFLDFSKLERIGFIGASPWWNLSCLLEWVLSGLMQTIRRNFIKGGMIEISFRDLSFFFRKIMPLKMTCGNNSIPHFLLTRCYLHNCASQYNRNLIVLNWCCTVCQKNYRDFWLMTLKSRGRVW